MSYPTNNQGEKVNPNLPGSYQPVMNQDNFNAPAHQLSTQQQEQVAELAEASSGHIHNTSLGQFGNSGGNSDGFGSGSLGNTNNTNLADTLGTSGGAQRGHLGQYEYTEGQLDEPLDRVRGGSEHGNTGRSGGLSGTGDGTRQAAGMGVGGGLAATAASQGLGNQRQERSIEDQRLGGLIGDDQSYGGSNSGSGRTGRGSNLDEAMHDASGHSHPGAGNSSSRMGAGAGAAAIGTGAGLGAASHHGGSSGLNSGSGAASGNHGAGAGDKGLLAQPDYQTGLTDELERRAQKSGSHAAGFGTHGNE